jgi:hypothetical protein
MLGRGDERGAERRVRRKEARRGDEINLEEFAKSRFAREIRLAIPPQ